MTFFEDEEPHGEALFKERLKFIWRTHFPKARPPFMNLSDNILYMITTHLSPLDKASLALTCKNVYDSFQITQFGGLYQILHISELGCPPVWLDREHPFINRELESQSRTKLVRSLENARWIYCPDCSKLHPRPGWNKHVCKSFLQRLHSCLRSRPVQRPTYEFESNIQHDRSLPLAQTRCMPSAGVVDLCPCLTITFRQRLLLTDIIMKGQEKVSSGKEHIFTTKLDFDPIKKQSEFAITHHCKQIVKLHTRASIQTRLTLINGHLMAENFYRFTFRRELLVSRPDLTPPQQGASNLKIVQWVRAFKRFLDADDRYPAFGYKFNVKVPAARGMNCPNCPEQKYEAKIYVDLGNGDIPDKFWLQNCRAL